MSKSIDSWWRKRGVTVSFAVCMLIVFGVGLAFVLQPSLTTIHKHIELQHLGLKHMDADEFSKLAKEDVIIFDVREEDEFAVSHINSAIQLSPNVDIGEFVEDYGEMLEGKDVIFYCSVGRRSSDALAQLNDELISLGVRSAANLRGGVFNWVNENRPLAVSEKVHPYNQYWGRLINDQDKVSYQPVNEVPDEN